MHMNPLKIKHLKNAIDIATIDDILSLAKSAPRLDAEVATFINGKYVKVKDTKTCNASLVDHSSFDDKINDLIEKCSELVKQKTGLTCIGQTSEFVHYTTGTKYWPHVDGQSFNKDTNSFTRGNIMRDITCIVYFNDEYTGGELYFQFFNSAYIPKPGDVMIYPSNWPYIHGVEPVTGNRYALVIWFETSPHAYPTEDEVINDPQVLRVINAQNRI